MNAIDSSGRIGVTGPDSAPIRIVSFLILLLGVSAVSVRRNQPMFQPSDSQQVTAGRSSPKSSHHTVIVCQKETGKKQSVDSGSNQSAMPKPGSDVLARLPTDTVVPDNNPPQTDRLENLDAYVTDRLANQPTVGSIDEVSRQAEADWSTQLDSWKKTCDWKADKPYKLYLSE